MVITNPTALRRGARISAADGRADRGGQRAQPAGRADQADGALARACPSSENPPLAQALYRSVEIGQAIPRQALRRRGRTSGLHLSRPDAGCSNARREGLSRWRSAAGTSRQSPLSRRALPSGSFPWRRWRWSSSCWCRCPPLCSICCWPSASPRRCWCCSPRCTSCGRCSSRCFPACCCCSRCSGCR